MNPHESVMTPKNNILNRTLLLDSTNIKINNQKPSIYVKLILEEKFGGDEKRLEEMMSHHFISKRALEYLREDNYDYFVSEREKTLKDAVSELFE